MPVIISMLRAVNVVGHNKIKMDELRALYESLKLQNPQTFIQSGNVVFRTDERDLVRLAKRIQNGIDKKFGCCPDVILRSSTELKGVIARNPFAKRRDLHPSKLLVFFLPGTPSPDARENVLRLKPNPEELHLVGREIYVYYPDGQGRSKLSSNVIERAVIRSSGSRLQIPIEELRASSCSNGAMTKTLAEAERGHILGVLEQTKGVVSGPNGAASRLGLPRTTLTYRMHKLGIVQRKTVLDIERSADP